MPRRHLRPARTLGAALAAVVLLTTAACGGSDEDARADTIEDAGAAEAATGGEPEAQDGSTTTAATGPLEDRLLTVDDLPTGWTVAPEDDAAADAPFADDCGLGDEFLPETVDAVEEAGTEFQKAEMGPFLFQSLNRFDGDAERSFAEGTARMEQCGEFEFTDAEGMKMSGSLRPVSFPSFGDETFAVRMTVEGDGFSLEGDIVVVRDGQDLLLLAGMGVTSPFGSAPFDPAEMERIATVADQKAFG